VQTLGGVVESSHQSEYGRAQISTKQDSQLYQGEEAASQQVWMSHGDHAEKLPDGFTVAATSEKVAPPPFPLDREWSIPLSTILRRLVRCTTVKRKDAGSNLVPVDFSNATFLQLWDCGYPGNPWKE
jgi:hypothetical protein